MGNYENNVNIFYFVSVEYLYILVIIVNYRIRKYLENKNIMLLLAIILGKLVGEVYYLLGGHPMLIGKISQHFKMLTLKELSMTTL